MLTISVQRIIQSLEERGQTDPYYHAVSRPEIAEAEATVGETLISLARNTIMLTSSIVSCHLLVGIDGHTHSSCPCVV
jgi:hypothetical protein